MTTTTISQTVSAVLEDNETMIGLVAGVEARYGIHVKPVVGDDDDELVVLTGPKDRVIEALVTEWDWTDADFKKAGLIR